VLYRQGYLTTLCGLKLRLRQEGQEIGPQLVEFESSRLKSIVRASGIVDETKLGVKEWNLMERICRGVCLNSVGIFH
jgi:hypothetical protein